MLGSDTSEHYILNCIFYPIFQGQHTVSIKMKICMSLAKCFHHDVLTVKKH